MASDLGFPRLVSVTYTTAHTDECGSNDLDVQLLYRINKFFNEQIRKPYFGFICEKKYTDLIYVWIDGSRGGLACNLPFQIS